MSRLIILIAGCVLSCAVAADGCDAECPQEDIYSRAVPLREPAPLVVMTKLSAVTVHDVVKAAAEQRGWRITDDQPGRIEAKYDPGRQFWITIAIAYDTQQIRISYVDSDGLFYRVEDGKRMIHTNAEGWFFSLASAINTGLLRAEPQEQ